MMITCPLCPGSQFVDVRLFLKHLRLTHSDDRGFNIQCSLQGCKRTFSNLKVFTNHIHAFHGLDIMENNAEGSPACFPPSGSGFEMDSSDSDQQDEGERDEDEGECDDERVQKAVATWILKTQECHGIPLSVMGSIVDGMESLYCLISNDLCTRVESVLKKANVPMDIIRKVNLEFPGNSQCKIFNGLRTKSQQLQFFKKNFIYVVSWAHT